MSFHICNFIVNNNTLNKCIIFNFKNVSKVYEICCLCLGYDRKEKMSCAINPQMDKWEMSLMSSLNFSQLFLHLMTLGIIIKIIDCNK